MSKKIHWKDFVNQQNDFQLSTYVYLSINQMMKNSLDLGTLLSDDPQKLRAFKEQVKKAHKETWSDIAEAFEFLGIIRRCICNTAEYCEICKGSRYVPTDSVNADVVTTQETFLAAGVDNNRRKAIEESLIKAREFENLP